MTIIPGEHILLSMLLMPGPQESRWRSESLRREDRVCLGAGLSEPPHSMRAVRELEPLTERRGSVGRPGCEVAPALLLARDRVASPRTKVQIATLTDGTQWAVPRLDSSQHPPIERTVRRPQEPLVCHRPEGMK